MKPGNKVDTMLVLEGPQGLQKTKAIRLLAHSDEWYLDQLGDLATKDAQQQLAGAWIVEMGELDVLCRTRSITTVKNFLTQQDDKYRPSYGRRRQTFPRQCIFVGTTNESVYLQDATGNRRFWPVKCTRIDHAALERDRHQLWAEALALYRQGEQWWLTDGEEKLAAGEQDDRVQLTEVEADVIRYLNGLKETVAAEGGEEIPKRVSVSDVIRVLYPLDRETNDGIISGSEADRAQLLNRLNSQVALAFKKAKWVKVARVGRAENRRTVYERGPDAMRPTKPETATEEPI
jgi:predicted P-loop ATPase